jgi:uncharacterized protein YndB with AHSA1/START domain
MPHEITVAVPPQQAFATFTEGMTAWWPPEYTWAHKTLEHIAIEPREGGHCFERGPHGFRCDWGRVVTCEPPERIAFTWQITPQRVPQPDPAQSSLVEVRFDPDGEAGTRVTLAHRHFSRHGEGAEGYEAAMASPQGWPLLLERFAGACAA